MGNAIYLSIYHYWFHVFYKKRKKKNLESGIWVKYFFLIIIKYKNIWLNTIE